jgi:magnesium transporter
MLAGAFMLNVFTLANGRLFQEEIESDHALAEMRPVWVDLEAPSEAEKGWIVDHFGLTIPSDAVDDDLEESARFYEEDNGELHIRSDFLVDDGETARNVRVAFILHRNILFSVHSEPLPVFRLLRLRARRIPALIEDAKDVLLKLYDADAEYSADALEGITTPPVAAKAAPGGQRPGGGRGALGDRPRGGPERASAGT